MITTSDLRHRLTAAPTQRRSTLDRLIGALARLLAIAALLGTFAFVALGIVGRL